MPLPKPSDEQIKRVVDIWLECGCNKDLASRKSGIPQTTIKNWLDFAVRKKFIPSSSPDGFMEAAKSQHKARQHIAVDNGTVFIGSDAHYWPGSISPAHKAFVKMIKEFQPKAIIMNGDVTDCASISRFPPSMWEKRPKLSDEIGECQTRLREIKNAAPKAKRYWTIGNHDQRLDTRLAMVAPEYANLKGVSLKDHFPDWNTAWSVWINNDVVVKHRFKNGMHAPQNNTLWAGKTIVTGHLHSLKSYAISDYCGTRYGVDCGTLASLFPQTSDAFVHYTEDNALNWRNGFVVLTFHNKRLVMPELVFLPNEKEYEFRGKVYRI